MCDGNDEYFVNFCTPVKKDDHLFDGNDKYFLDINTQCLPNPPKKIKLDLDNSKEKKLSNTLIYQKHLKKIMHYDCITNSTKLFIEQHFFKVSEWPEFIG